MNKELLKQAWYEEEKQDFRGWDFSYIADRWQEESLPWNYRSLIDQYLRPDHPLLDMGTGGGEFLLSLGHPYNLTSVTEAWPPNIQLCKEKLAPLGIVVEGIEENDPLPFEDETFDLVISRHESYDLREVKRILKPNGIFITQQVGGKNNAAMSARLLDGFKLAYADFTLENELAKARSLGFDLLKSDEYFPVLKFYDIGALVYFAGIIEWEFPDFSVGRCLDVLYELEEERVETGYVTSVEHRFMMVLRK